MHVLLILGMLFLTHSGCIFSHLGMSQPRVAARWAILKGAILKRQADAAGRARASCCRGQLPHGARRSRCEWGGGAPAGGDHSVRAVATYGLFQTESLSERESGAVPPPPPSLAGSWHCTSSRAFPDARVLYFHLQPQVSLQVTGPLHFAPALPHLPPVQQPALRHNRT